VREKKKKNFQKERDNFNPLGGNKWRVAWEDVVNSRKKIGGRSPKKSLIEVGGRERGTGFLFSARQGTGEKRRERYLIHGVSHLEKRGTEHPLHRGERERGGEDLLLLSAAVDGRRRKNFSYANWWINVAKSSAAV